MQLALAGWAAANLVLLTLADATLPFDRPSLADQSVTDQVLAASVALLEVLLLIGVTYLLTRNRTIPDVAARAPHRALARRETLLLLGYGVVGQLGGLLLGRLSAGTRSASTWPAPCTAPTRWSPPPRRSPGQATTLRSMRSCRTCGFDAATPPRR